MLILSISEVLKMNEYEKYVKAGARLRELRKTTGQSIFAVGRAIGVSGSYISQIENGKRPASDSVLVALAELYGVDKNELFGYYGRMTDDAIEKIMDIPALRRLFTKITSKSNLTPEELEAYISDFKEAAQELYNKGDNLND
ncbi:helix-turn-helix domain-containing protein [Cellulosilyticum sp. WCF-2]|nr:helix-turn-helix domain-containing protein [Cellulosilyticum sp. WCF-2]